MHTIKLRLFLMIVLPLTLVAQLLPEEPGSDEGQEAYQS